MDSLIALEAAVRLGAMTAAALELNLTQSAISHRIRRLERFFAVPLLIRSQGSLLPTMAGKAVLENLAQVLDGLADMRVRCQSAQNSDRLRVGVGAALTDLWLGRRLSAYAASHPDIAIELVVMDNEAPERATDVDVRILWVTKSEARKSAIQQPLFREHVFPVCSPALLPSGYRAGDSSVLTRVPLLHKVTSAYQAGDEWFWANWFERLALAGKPKEAMRFSAIGPSIAAAIGGAGAVLGRSMLVHDALKDGRLVRMLPVREARLCGKVHVVRWPARLIGDFRVKAFAQWIVGQAEVTGKDATSSQVVS